MKIIKTNSQITLPDFLVIGAARSGTSSLYFYLRDHPEIFMPELKEPHFFSFLGKPSPHPCRPPWTIEEYTKLFSDAEENQIVGEASSSYLYYYEQSICNLKQLYGEKCSKLKLLAILRNPIERAWSYYMLMKRGGRHKEGFFETVEHYQDARSGKDFHNFVLSGMYYEQVKAYFENFQHVKIFLYEELQSNPDRVLREIFEYLNLKDRKFLPGNLGVVYNPSGIPKKKIFRPIYNFLFHDSNLKTLIKPIISYEARQRIKTALAKKIVDRQKIPEDVKKFLRPRFSENMKALATILQDSEKRPIVNGWLSL